MNKNQDKGFTLVELLIVIVILGILATVTVFAVRGITDSGQKNACATEEKVILTASEAYYAQEGGAPANFGALTTGDYLNDSAADLASRWDFAGGDATTGSSVTPAAGGKCVGYDA